MEAFSIFLEKPQLLKKKDLITKCLYLVKLTVLFPLVIF